MSNEPGASGDAGQGEGQNGAGSDNGSPAALSAASPFDGLQEEGSRDWIENAGVKDVESLVKMARNSESLIGKSFQKPGEDADQSEIDAFYERLGRPKDVSGYELTPPEDMPEDLPYDTEFASKFAEAAHKYGITTEQAKGLHDFYVGEMVGGYQSGIEATTAQLAESTTAATSQLEKDWGAKQGTPEFKENVALADRAIRELGGDELIEGFTKAGMLGPGGIILNPAIAKAMSNVGKELFGSSGGLEMGDGSADNPFAKDTQNLTKQSELQRNDPRRAKALIQAAGRDPANWGL
ncbi:MAG: hypothetical protein NXI17_05815 [Alphaproteobacteria bacterium]|nr:hypothetical protein [Alphaproteobacteria bacterium]